MIYETDCTAQTARNRLAAFHFRGEDVFKSVSVLSGGELSRLKLCILMDEDINFLILDEPTNHLDIASREWIENAVEQFGGTLLFVSHDRYFINKFATRIWELEGGAIHDYPFGFEKYRAVKAQQEKEKAPPAVEKKPKKPAAKGTRNQNAARKQLTICEREIAKAEEQLAALDRAMEEHACDYEQLRALCEEKMRLRRRWTNFMNSGMPWQRRRRGETDLWLQGAAACGAAGSAFGGAARAAGSGLFVLLYAYALFGLPAAVRGCVFCAVALFVAAAGTPFARAVLVILAALLIGGLAVFTVLEAQIVGYGRTDRKVRFLPWWCWEPE